LKITCHYVLQLREDLSIFEVPNPCKYFYHYVKYIGIDIAISSDWLEKMS
jgi:hypothetical protein